MAGPGSATTGDHPVLARAALRYESLGWSVIPVHTPRSGRCSCGDPDCPAPGKHPRVRWLAYTGRRASEGEIGEWWRRWPDANVAVVTGAVSGVAVLDVDPRAGGDRALADLEARWGSLPPTTEARTGGEGRHVWFTLAGAETPSAVLAPGAELKAEGGSVVVPPSTHASGRRYAWVEGRAPWELAPAPMPDWLASLGGGTREPGGPRHPLAGVPLRTPAERGDFAQAWNRAGIDLREGDRYYLCPFHEDHHPSLHIDADGCRWFCFGCRRGGGIGSLRRSLGDEPAAPESGRLQRNLEDEDAVTLPGAHVVEVVGESRHQDELLDLSGGARRYGGVDIAAIADLRAEPGNRFDPDAVAVRIRDARVGYLRHSEAVRLRTLIDEARRRHGAATCRAVIRGGWDRGRGDVGAFGVTLLLPGPG